MANEFVDTVWQGVRNRRIRNQKFRREHPIPPYTVNFCCLELKLILEVDGADHFNAAGQERDRVRDHFLARQGCQVVRIAGYEVLREAGQVIAMIQEQVTRRLQEVGKGGNERPQAPHPRSLSPKRGEGR